MLFADGAGAVVLGPTAPGAGRVGPILLRPTRPRRSSSISRGRASGTIQMDGHATFKHAVNRMSRGRRSEAVAARRR